MSLNSAGPYELPLVEDYALTPGTGTVTLAVMVPGSEGAPTVVFIPIPLKFAQPLAFELMKACDAGLRPEVGTEGSA
jgi:hypothetical protein